MGDKCRSCGGDMVRHKSAAVSLDKFYCSQCEWEAFKGWSIVSVVGDNTYHSTGINHRRVIRSDLNCEWR